MASLKQKLKTKTVNQLGFSPGNAIKYGAESKGQQAYTTPGTYSWTAPEGVTSVSVVAVGGGGGGYPRSQVGQSGGAGGGGGLGWKNNIPVIPGQSYTVVVGAGTVQWYTPAGNSYFIDESTVMGIGGQNAYPHPSQANYTYGGLGGGYVGDGGGTGGKGGDGDLDTVAPYFGSGGGGAGGYSGNGGDGLYGGEAGNDGWGGGGAGGPGRNIGTGGGLHGGGVGLLGEGASGTGNGYLGSTSGGSGGTNGTASVPGVYGGGAHDGNGGKGAVRIIWPGNSRQFPSTQTADEEVTIGLPTSGVTTGTLALTTNDNKLKLWNGVTWATVVYD